MKQPLLRYAFQPATRRIDFSAEPGFDIRRLLAIVHLPSDTLLYGVGKAGPAYTTLAGSVLTLSPDTTQMGANDPLLVEYDQQAHGASYVSADSPTQIFAGPGSLAAYDLGNIANTARVVTLVDSASVPGGQVTPLATVVLGGGAGRALAIPGALAFTAGLWAITGGRNNASAAPGDVLGSFFIL